jgi:hypothetical protein
MSSIIIGVKGLKVIDKGKLWSSHMTTARYLDLRKLSSLMREPVKQQKVLLE